MPEAQAKLPLFPKVMPRWFWPLVGVVAVSFTSLIVTIAVLMGMRRNSEPMQLALGLCRADARVVGRLGEPVKPGFFVLGEHKGWDIGERRDWGAALKGPQGEGLLQFSAVRAKGGEAWKIQHLQVILPGSAEPLTLVGDPQALPWPLDETRSRRLGAPMHKALEAAAADARVGAALGGPLVAGFLVTGPLPQMAQGGGETLAWQTEAIGPKGSAPLRFSAARPNNTAEWQLTRLEVDLPAGRLLLVDAPPAPAAPAPTAPAGNPAGR